MATDSLTRFIDSASASHHSEFQRWRRSHPTGALLSFTSTRRATLHRTACPHLGDTEWAASAQLGSLTSREKRCADAPAPLLWWALEQFVEVFDCYDCARMAGTFGLEPLTAFSWGYAGWGNAVDQLLTAVDAREKARGFAPPAFADVRVRRSVRAIGFNGTAFQNRLGPTRHRWFSGLGNERVADGVTDIAIRDPSAAYDLLAFVQEMAAERRRVIFFCSCGPASGCHRQTVRALLLKAASEKGIPLHVGEWPGDVPRVRRLAPVNGGRWRYPGSLPLGRDFPQQGLATLPHGSVVLVQQDGCENVMVTGPAEFHEGWRLYPVKEDSLREPSSTEVARRIQGLRQDRGWEGISSV